MQQLSAVLPSVWLVLVLGACTSATAVQLSESSTELEASSGRFALFSRDPRLQAAATRAQQRLADAIGEPGLVLAGPDAAARCQPAQAGCGFELAFADVVYCPGDPDPALACTAQGAGGATLGIEMQAALAGDELDNRLIHELLHVITQHRAPHARDGLFMAYTLGNERLSAGTLEAVCAHFSCTRLVAEEEALLQQQRVEARGSVRAAALTAGQ